MNKTYHTDNKKRIKTKNTQNKIKIQQQNIIYGRHACVSALNNKERKINKIYVTNEALKKEDIKNSCKNFTNITNILSREQLNNMLSPNSVHNGIIIDTTPLEEFDLQDIIIKSKIQKSFAIAILDQATDPHNIGAIIRSALAFNISAIIIPAQHSPQLTSTIAKTSSGAIESVAIVYVKNISHTIKELKKHNFWIAGLDSNEKSSNIQQADFSDKFAFVFGEEGKGLRKLTKDNCDLMLHIAMNSKMESLNLSNAAAIAFYEWYKNNK